MQKQPPSLCQEVILTFFFKAKLASGLTEGGCFFIEKGAKKTNKSAEDLHKALNQRRF